MRKKLILAPALAALGFSGLAFAEQYEPRPYVGINGTLATVEVGSNSNNSEDFDVGLVSARAGAMVTPYFGVESRIGYGFGDDEATVDGSRVKVEIGSVIGGYAVLGVPLGPVFPYVIGGYSRVEVSFDGDSETDHGTSYGAGVNLALTDRVAVNGEYMWLYDEDQVDISGPSVGLTYRF